MIDLPITVEMWNGIRVVRDDLLLGGTKSRTIPYLLDTDVMRGALASVARHIGQPTEVWTAAGSGTLTRALQQAWPNTAFNAVRVGTVPDIGRAKMWVAVERYEQNAKEPPPFPSCGNYDAKVWRFVMQHAHPGALFWNVAG